MNLKIILPLFAIFLIVIFAVFYGNPSNGSNYAHSWNKEGIIFNSDNFSSLSEASYLSKKTFLISPAMSEKPSQQNSNYTNDFLIPFLVVLSGNDKNAVTFIRIFNENNEFSHCVTNLGDVKEEKQLSIEECSSFLNSPDIIKIKLNAINDKLPASEAVLSEDSITITPKDYSDLKGIFIVISQELLPNYKDIIKKSNILSSYVLK